MPDVPRPAGVPLSWLLCLRDQDLSEHESMVTKRNTGKRQQDHCPCGYGAYVIWEMGSHLERVLHSEMTQALPYFGRDSDEA